jgi:hypothetical protein
MVEPALRGRIQWSHCMDNRGEPIPSELVATLLNGRVGLGRDLSCPRNGIDPAPQTAGLYLAITDLASSALPKRASADTGGSRQTGAITGSPNEQGLYRLAFSLPPQSR